MSITVTRTVPPSSPIKSITLTSTDLAAELVSYLSGSISDYQFESSAPGHVAVTAIQSYKERFRRTKAELDEVVKEKRKLEEERDTLRRAHVYRRLLNELHEVWWPQLPEEVQLAFTHAGRWDLPGTIVSWWLQWNSCSPSWFPLPLSLCHFGPVTLNSQGRFIFDRRTGEESELSVAVNEAWNFLPDTVRHLMLFAWAGVHSVHSLRNDLAHPDISSTTAQELLDQDFSDTFLNLHTAASYIAGYLFEG